MTIIPERPDGATPPASPTDAQIAAALGILRAYSTGPDRWLGELSTGHHVEIRAALRPESYPTLGPDGAEVAIVGTLTAIKVWTSAQSLPWATAILLSPLDGPIGVDIYPAVWAVASPPPASTPVVLTGRVDRRGPTVRIAALSITTPTPGGAS
jgi:hypothetical protein